MKLSTRWMAPIALVAGLATAACVVPTRHGPRVVVPMGHVHSVSCGHYFHGGGWYFLDGHTHGSGCGHKFHGGHWRTRR